MRVNPFPYGGDTENNPDKGQTPYQLIQRGGDIKRPFFFFDHLESQYLEASPTLPEYPQTRESGYAYLIPVNPGRPQNHNRLRNGKDSPTHNEIIRRIQYSARPQSKKFGKSPYLNTSAYYHQFTCAGVRVCSNLHPKLRALHHTKATAETFYEINDILHFFDMKNKAGDNTKTKNAYSLYVNACRLFIYGKPCSTPNDTCRPILKQHPEGTAGSSHSYICCVNFEPQSGHYLQSLATQPNTDFNLLKKYFDERTNFHCGVIGSAETRKPQCNSCGHNGIMMDQPCGVRFTVILPVDPIECPYVLFVSHGVHTHPPTLPNKTPLGLFEDLRNLIHEFREAPDNSGLGLFIPNLGISTYIEDPSERKMTNLKDCFSISHPLEAFLDKERMVLFPGAMELNKLRVYSYCHPELKSYLSISFFNSEGAGLILACHEQVQLLHSVKSLKIEMNTRKLWNEDIGEAVITAFVPLYEKVMTLWRVFTNKQHGDGYKYIFEKIFEMTENVTDMPFRFSYLHGHGLERITLKTDDGLSLEESKIGNRFSIPDGNLILGLGRYLSSIDPQNRSVEWHVKYSGLIVVEDSPEEPSQNIDNPAEYTDADYGTNEANFAGFNELDDSMLAAVLKERLHDTKDLDGRGLPEDSESDKSYDFDYTSRNKGKRRRVSSGSDVLEYYRDPQQQGRTIDDLSIRTGQPYYKYPRPTIESQELYTTPAQQSSHASDDFSVSPQTQRSQLADSERNRPRRVPLPQIKSRKEKDEEYEKRREHWSNILEDPMEVLSMLLRESYIEYLRNAANFLETQNEMIAARRPVPNFKTGQELWRTKPQT